MLGKYVKILTFFLVLIMLGFSLGNGIGGCSSSKSVAPGTENGEEDGDGNGEGDGDGEGDVTVPTASLNLDATTSKMYTTDPLRISFSEPMNQEATQGAILITDAAGTAVAGTFSWDENDLVFIPEEGLWRTNHPYNLAISVEAADQAGNALAEAISQTFKPQLNLHDVNGDKIDDFMLGASYGNAGGAVDEDGDPAYSGQAYLFLGRQNWDGVNLDAKDAIYTVSEDAKLGWETRIVGDINGDGFADMAISAPKTGAPPSIDDLGDIELDDSGMIFLIYGSNEPTDQIFAIDNLPNAVIVGPSEEIEFGKAVMPVGDVNADGLADFVVGAYSGDPDAVDTGSRFYLFLGRETAFLGWASAVDSVSAVYTVGDKMLLNSTFQIAGCDMNGDGFSDLVFGEPGADGLAGGIPVGSGKVHIVAGSEDPGNLDLRDAAAAATATIVGGHVNDMIGLVACGNINGDQYADLVVGAPGLDSDKGAAYVILGQAEWRNYNLEEGGDVPFAYFQGVVEEDNAVGVVCVPGDVINNDGLEDIVIGAPLMEPADTNEGMAFLLAGSNSGFEINMDEDDLPATSYNGQIASMLGSCKRVGDINNDGFSDIILGAPAYVDGRGRVYLIFGVEGSLPSMNLNIELPGPTITGRDLMNFLSLGASDFGM